MGRWTKIAAGIGALYVGVVGLLYVFQRDLMYLPDQTRRVAPSHYPMLAGVREIELKRLTV
jgi:hypothetical protein